MKKLLVAALAFAVTPALFSVTCTITDDNRVPVGDTPLQYEHKRTAGDFNCARTNKDIPADIKNFADEYKLNSSSDFTIAAAKKAIATKEAITAQANALAKKIDELGARAAKTASSKLESASQQVGAKLQPAASKVSEKIEKGVESLKQTEAYKKLEEGTTQADVLGKKAVKKLETCVLADKNRMALVREDGSHFEFDKKSTTCKLADAPQELQDEAQGKAAHAINKNLIKLHESVHVVKESAKEKFAQAKTAISEKAQQAKKALAEKLA